MTDNRNGICWHLYNDAEAVAEAAAGKILRVAGAAIAGKGRFTIVLAGGSTPERAYRLLAGSDADWSCWEIYFGDERCLPRDDPQRNSAMAARAWLAQVAIPDRNIHPIPAELGAEVAARSYEEVVESVRPFDLVLLGMGEDGHTASLFPGHRHAANELVHAIHGAPKPPPDRVSLGEHALANAGSVLVLITGRGKRAAVRQWQAGIDLPVARVAAGRSVEVLVDRDASG